MAEKILKGINFPGLEDTYIVPQVEDAVDIAKTYTDSQISEFVGDSPVAEQITTAINNIDHPVDSVNGKTGAVMLGSSDIGAVPTTRTVNGKALSSNITLSASDVGAAPSGYGYGGYAITLTNPTSEAELETALSGIYDAMQPLETKFVTYVDWTSWRWFGILSKSSVNNGSFVAHSAVYGGSKIVKTKNSGAWKPMEWENPPMEYGVEYRTTERYKGYPVYTVTLNFGYTRDAGYYSVTAPNVEIEYPDFTVIDVSAVCLDAESTKEIGCYYNATQFFEHISVSTMSSPLTVRVKRNEYFDYNGVIFNTIVTIKYVRVDLDSSYANA